ncbi:hypothetical protein FIV42_19240 [Persicimonas caeni]|uniref:Uncharacterized protein n=1 Tax=Persicimonas caeni TaxID=2292766 RepID=A0A4Y6PX41_PERCE|nr:hypothetical protein [Persicimonas caeni]QDG52800.1 hypothetical protein FIV42_19240 [Persicimonas caeni]QED34022.1 hypothetical protein FRD00_19235 [Persicimonas caeni]
MQHLRPALVILAATALCVSCTSEDEYTLSSRLSVWTHPTQVAAGAAFRTSVRVPAGPTNLDDEAFEVRRVSASPSHVARFEGALPQGRDVSHGVVVRTFEAGTATVDVAVETAEGERLRNVFDVQVVEVADAVFDDPCAVDGNPAPTRILDASAPIELDFQARDASGRIVGGLGGAFFSITQDDEPVRSEVDLGFGSIRLYPEQAGQIEVRAERFGVDHRVGLVEPGDVDRIEVVQRGGLEGTFVLAPQLYAGDALTCRQGDTHTISATITTPQVCQFWVAEEGEARFEREAHDAFDIWAIGSGECSVTFEFAPGAGGSGVRQSFTVDLAGE